jgi:hypothetical protein
MFISLMRTLNASESEFGMTDNYFAFIANIVPEVWRDKCIDLGGGQAFKVGTEGDESNQRHILHAAELLDEISACKRTCIIWQSRSRARTFSMTLVHSAVHDLWTLQKVLSISLQDQRLEKKTQHYVLRTCSGIHDSTVRTSIAPCNWSLNLPTVAYISLMESNRMRCDSIQCMSCMDKSAKDRLSA